MGRRSEKIKNRKEAQTRARTKDFARVGKQIAIAVKNGGTDTTTNKALADALDAAKAVSFPKETIERTIARATSSDQADYKASSFEIYGHGGVVRVTQPFFVLRYNVAQKKEKKYPTNVIYLDTEATTNCS